jgi:hypothetical protein
LNPADNLGGYLYETFPEAVFKENQFIGSIRGNFTKNFNLTGFYTLSYANGNNNGSAVDAYDLDKNYGRAGFVTRNNLFMMANYTAPWGIRLNPFLVAQSGRPYNITLPTDPLNNFFNQRPAAATDAQCQSGSSEFVQTTYGCFDTIPAAGYTPIPVNLGNGPAAVAVNMRISKAFGIGPKLVSATPRPDGGLPPGGPPPGGPPPGGGGRGGPGGGGGGGFGGGPGGGPMGLGGGGNSTGHRYSLTFSAQALNLFNDIDKGQPNGTITAPNFGKSTNLAGGIFSQGSAARRIFVQAVFSF